MVNLFFYCFYAKIPFLAHLIFNRKWAFMQHLPDNIIIIIADSLRYKTVTSATTPTPYLNNNSYNFTQARSAGCWTLPATASLFTGLSPHQHGATSQTRSINKDIPTIAELLKNNGYSTHQVTANIATTEIFGLHRGFDEVVKIWTTVKPKFKKMQQFLVLVGKPRLRKKLFSKDFLMAKMSEDLDMAKAWMQQMINDSFNTAKSIIQRNELKNKKSFIFINLMETHFPYHISPVFKFSTPGLFEKFAEAKQLFHLANQTFLTDNKHHTKTKQLKKIENRQLTSYNIIAETIDAFVAEQHQNKNNFVVFGGDHGETFGEQNWLYHFSNVTDGGNHVPLFILPPGKNESTVVKQKVSTKHLFHTILKFLAINTNGPSLINEPDDATAVLESFWYNNKGKTLPQFRHNQFCFIQNNIRYRFFNNAWYTAPISKENKEPHFEKIKDKGINAINEFVTYNTEKEKLNRLFEEFRIFSTKI